MEKGRKDGRASGKSGQSSIRGKVSSQASGPQETTSPETTPQQLEYTRIMYALQYSSGPLPSPTVLERYSQVIPGGAERIVGWAERQAAHRQSLEAKRVDADIRNESRGQIFAFIITLLSIASGTFLIYSGRDASGLTLMISELTILAGVFVYSNVSQKKELHRKMRELLEGKKADEKDPDR